MTALDPRTHARTTDPDTSKAAAAQLGDKRTILARLLAVFVRADRFGLSAASAADWAGVDRWQASKRVSDLKRLGLVEDTGKRIAGNSGRPMAVLTATALGRDVHRGRKDWP